MLHTGVERNGTLYDPSERTKRRVQTCAGLGVLCAEAQADGVPCDEVGRDCVYCDRAQSPPHQYWTDVRQREPPVDLS